MRIPKRYGQSRKDVCPFCGKESTAVNKEGVPVCSSHKSSKMPELKCACGSWLEQKSGKWGPYFHCINCGNINFRKAMEINDR